MNNEVQSLIRRIEIVNNEEPWFGRSVFSILEEVDPKKAFIKPAYSAGKESAAHSLADLLYHMITWSAFTLKRLEKDKSFNMAAAEKLDWRVINPKIHTWRKGVTEFKSIHKKIIALLLKKDDDFLREIVDFRKYNYRFLINGMIEHTIYHLGQIAYLKKLLG